MRSDPGTPEKALKSLLSRREMLRLAAAAPLGAGVAILAPTRDADAMLYIPKQERLWDTWMLYHDNTFYLFHLSMEVSRPADPGWNGYSLATSTDGIHWKEQGCVYRDQAGLGSGYVYKSPTFARDGKFLMEISRNNRAFSFAESADLIHWKELGPECNFARDRRWYSPRGRWDMMHVIERPGGGCLAYWTADPIGAVGFGFGESDDGIHWRALPPPLIDWGGEDVVLSGQVEVTSVDKIGEKYYALLHTASNYRGDGSGAYVLVADNPAGPFRADAKNYRFFSTNTAQWKHSGMRCCTCCHTPQGVLVNNHHVTRGVEKNRANTPWWLAPGASIYLAPLKRAIVDRGGHLRLGYWEGNEKLKAKESPLEVNASETFGAAQWRCFAGGAEAAGAPRISDLQADGDPDYSPKFSLLMFPNKFNVSEGVVFEGTMTIPSRLSGWSGAAGIFIEEEGGTQGTAILNQTVNCADDQIRGLIAVGIIKKQAKDNWDLDDRISTGINVKQGRFRLLLRGSLLEYYLNDLLARAYSLPERTYSGRLGLIVADADVHFEDVRAWSMELKGA